MSPRQASFSTEELLVLDALQHRGMVPADLRICVPRLLDDGIVERIGHGRGVRFVLSRKFDSFLGKKGVYTRKRGLDRDTNKALLMKHIQQARPEGAQLHDLQQVLKDLSRSRFRPCSVN
jgi:ATP-dependent DNA helicase RecG